MGTSSKNLLAAIVEFWCHWLEACLLQNSIMSLYRSQGVTVNAPKTPFTTVGGKSTQFRQKAPFNFSEYTSQAYIFPTKHVEICVSNQWNLYCNHSSLVPSNNFLKYLFFAQWSLCLICQPICLCQTGGNDHHHPKHWGSQCRDFHVQKIAMAVHRLYKTNKNKSIKYVCGMYMGHCNCFTDDRFDSSNT